MKVGIYARYSSDNQRDASIVDQLRVCRAFAERQGWTIAEVYSDHAVSGATLLRPGFQSLMRDALNRRFDFVLAESLDRFGRDQEDTAGLFKRLTFAGVCTARFGSISYLEDFENGSRTGRTMPSCRSSRAGSWPSRPRVARSPFRSP